MIINSLRRCAALARSTPALVAGACLTAIFFVFQTTRFRPRNFTLTADASIVYDKSRAIWRSGAYPARLALGNFNEVFPYPPPAVVLFGLLAKLGPVAFHIVWLMMMAAGFVATFRFLVQHETADIRRAFIALMLPVIALVSNPIVHDLSNLNNNLIVLGLSMAAYALMAKRPLWAGALLAIPIALKLYVGAVLIWVLIYRRSAALSCAACLVLLAGLPMALFGFDTAIALYRGWLEQVAIVNSPWVYSLTPATGGPPLISLRRAAAYLTGADAFSDQTVWVLRAMQASWLAILGGYAIRAYRFGKADVRSRAALADWAVLLLVPLPFSPWLEPHHGVPMIVPTALCLLMLFDWASAASARIVAAVALAAIVVIQLVPQTFAERGLIYLMQFDVLTIALAAMRPALSETASQERHRRDATILST